MANAILTVEKNALFLILSECFVKALGLGLTVVIARKLGVEQFGLLHFAYALTGICLIISDFGFDRLTVREVARSPSGAGKLLSHISSIRGFFYLGLTGLCAGLAGWVPSSGKNLLVIFLVLMEAAVQQHLLFICSFFKAVEKMEKEALIRGLLSLLLFLSGIGMLSAGSGLEGFVVSRVAVSVFCLGLGFFWVKREFHVRWVRPGWRDMKKLIRTSLPLAFFQMFVTLYLSINMVVLGLISGDAAVGYYSASHKIILLLFVIPGAFSWASLPALSRHWKESPGEFRAAFQRSIRYLLLLSVPVAAGAFLLAREAILLLYGKEYQLSITVLRILVFCIVPDYLNHIFSIALISMDRQKTAVAASVTGASLAVFTSLIFIPLWGERGAAASLVVALSSVFLFQLMALLPSFHAPASFKVFARAVLAGAGMAICLFFMKKFLSMLPLLIAGSAAAYIGFLFILGEARADEFRTIFFRVFRLFNRNEERARP